MIGLLTVFGQNRRKPKPQFFVWGPFNLGSRPYFSRKKWRPFFFFSHHRPCVSAITSPQKPATFFANHSRFTRGSPIVPACKNLPLLLWGPCSDEHAKHAYIQHWPIMWVKYCLPVPAFRFWPKLMHPAVRSLCNSWASCLHSVETTRN